MKPKLKRTFSLVLALCLVLSLVPSLAMGMPLVPTPHIVGNETPPTESPVNNFTVGFVNPGDYVAPVHEFWENGRDTFFFVTGDPTRAGEHGTTVTITYESMDFDATVHYIPRQNIAGVGGGAGAPNVALNDVSPLVAPAGGAGGQSTAPVPPGFDDAHRIRFESNTVYFFDAGAFVDTDDFSVVNRFSITNVAFVGLYRDPTTGESLTTFYKTPAGAARGGNFATGFMARTVLNSPNIHIENIIWDGSNIDMVRQGGTIGGQNQASRGEYFWFISTNATDFVARDVILQNIGSRTTLPVIENFAANNQRKNTAVNIFTAGSIHSGTEGSQRNFENLTIRNTSTMTGFGIIQFNRTSGNYFLNLDVANPNADGVGIAHSTLANTYPIKIEHRPIGAATAVAPNGTTISGNQVAETQSDIVFAGTLAVPNHANSAVYIQDYRYQNILIPDNFGWALSRITNGTENTAAIRVFNHKRPQTAQHALLQLNTGYWVVENQTGAPDMQTQLNNINTIINANAPFANVVPATNIKMIADAAGEINGFIVPTFPSSHANVNIVALRQTSNPGVGGYVHPTRSNAIGLDTPAELSSEFVLYAGTIGGIILPNAIADSITIFNFDFKDYVEWTIEDAVEGSAPDFEPGIVNFTEQNSGRNRFLQFAPLSHLVTYTVTDPAPASFTPAIPSVENHLPDATVTRADGLTATTNVGPGGQVGTWVFNGWTTTDPGVTITGSTFIMPGNDVTFVGTWTFTPRVTSGNGGYGGNGSNGGGWQPPNLPAPLSPYPYDVPQRQAFLIGKNTSDEPKEERPIDPYGNITRAEVATIFFRLIADNVRAQYWSQENPFDDVVLEQWFNNAVSTTHNMEIFFGIGDNRFAPHDNITRGELAAVLVRFMSEDQRNTFAIDNDQFNDIANHWANTYINEAGIQGWIEGPQGLGGPFLPDQPITRAETAAMVNRMFNRLIESADYLLPDMVTWHDNTNSNSWYYLHIYMATNSFTYRFKSNGYMELLEIIEPRDWTVLEKPYSRPEHIFTR